MFLFRQRRTAAQAKSTRPEARSKKGRRTCRPALEVLEDRLTPNAILTVDSALDTGAANTVLTLRQALNINNGSLPVASLTPQQQAQVSGTPGAANTIQFAIPGGPATITLSAALPVVAGALNVQGPAPAPGGLTIDGAAQFQLFNVPDGASLTIANLTLADGSASNGAAIEVHRTAAASSTFLTVTNVLFLNNQATGDSDFGGRGGAIYATGTGVSAVTVTLSQTAFNGNSAGGKPGGAAGGAVALEGAAFTLTGCTFFNNFVFGDSSTGGALAFPAPKDASAGGGIGLISTTTIDSNSCQSPDSAGGALAINTPGSYTVTRSTFSSNLVLGSGAAGGAMAVTSAATVAFLDDTFANNSADSGGGANPARGGALWAANGQNSSTMTIHMTNVTVANNSASNTGGGLDFEQSGAASATVAITLVNTLVATNSAPTDTDVASAFAISALHCLIGDGTGSTITATQANGNQVGTARARIDPKLSPLGFYGGLTQTMLLEPGSPAIDAGTNTVTQPGDTDQRGLPRQLDGNNDGSAVTDIGAVEVGILATLTATPNPVQPGQIVHYTATLNNDGPDLANSLFQAVIDPNTTHVGTITATPIAVDDTEFVVPGGNITFDARTNDQNPDGHGPLTITNFQRVPEDSTMAGTLVLNNNGTFTYTPPAASSGMERFQYTITNGDGLNSVVPGYLTFLMVPQQSLPPAATPLTQGQLDGLVSAARQRWESTGLSASQDVVLQSTQFLVANLAGSALAATAPGCVSVNANAAGVGWFVDPTPLADSAFATVLSPTRRAATAGTPQANTLDLLTVVMNEMGQAMNIDPALAPDLFSTPVVGVRDLPPGANLAPTLDTLFAQYGFHFQDSYYQNWLGHGEKWFQNAQSQWFFITADGHLYSWNGGAFAGSSLVQTVDPLLYADPTRLFSPAAQLPAVDVTQLEQLPAVHGFHFGGSYYLNWLGLQEKWFLDGSNHWFYLTPAGSLYQWNSSGSILLTAVNPAVYADPTALFLTAPPLSAAAAQQAVNLQTAHGFHFGGSYFLNWLGQQEKWLQDSGNHWFFLTPGGHLYQWGGGGFSGSTFAGNLDPQVYTDPTLLLNLPAPLCLFQSSGPLTQAQLNSLVPAAAQRWLATGLTVAQQTALQNLTFAIAALGNGLIGAFTPGQVTVDVSAGGLGWFVDATPQDDAEFTTGRSTRLYAAPLSAPAGHVDLLTVVVHEMGHALGLPDENANPGDVMYTYLGTGERRLPDAGEAVGAVPGSFTGGQAQKTNPAAFSGKPIDPVNVGQFPAGKAVQIFYQAQVNNPFPQGVSQVGSQGTLTGSVFFQEATIPVVQATDDPTTPALGDPTFVQVVNPPGPAVNPVKVVSFWEPDLILGSA